MIPKQIIGEWYVQDWDHHWPPVYTKGTVLQAEVDKDGDLCVDHEVPGYGSTQVYIPLEVLAHVLASNGYDVKKR